MFRVNPFRTALPFGDKLLGTSVNLSPKRECVRGEKCRKQGKSVEKKHGKRCSKTGKSGQKAWRLQAPATRIGPGSSEEQREQMCRSMYVRHARCMMIRLHLFDALPILRVGWLILTHLPCRFFGRFTLVRPSCVSRAAWAVNCQASRGPHLDWRACVAERSRVCFPSTAPLMV